MTVTKLFEEIDRLYPEYLDFLEDVAKIESPSRHKEGVDAVGKYFIDKAQKHGWKIETLHEEAAGDVVCITMNPDAKNAPIALSGHIDTVHPLGLFKAPIVRRDEEKMYGPGVLDCKGGVVAAFLAMDALERCGFKERPIMLLLQTDEEVSSAISSQRTINYICDKAKNAVAFLNLEGADGDTLVLWRKGILRYEFTVHGIAGHSSKCFEAANAVTEAAHKIIELEKMKDDNGVTCNCGVIHGGTVANSVADTCVFTADIRFTTQDELEEVKKKLQAVAEHTYVSGCSCDIKEVSLRPAMEKCDRNFVLLDKINEINKKAGLPTLTARMALGGSDAAYTTLAGIPCVDSIGVSGKFHHSIDEYIEMRSLAHSAKQQAVIALMI